MVLNQAQPVRTLKTLSRRDVEFTAYLDGSFSKELIAIPLRSLNVGLQTEEVTFEIVPASAVVKPSNLQIARALVRPSALIFSAGPMCAVLSRSFATGASVDLSLAVSCFIGVLAFQIATNLFNDYGDHIKGQDRVRPNGGSRAIQNGWIRARNVRHAAVSVMAFAALCGVPAIVRSPVLIVAGLALLYTLEFAFQKLRLKARGWSEGLAFLLTGPLLTSAYAWAIKGDVSVGDATLGCLFGSLALLYFHSANFENIMVDSQAGARTWATRAGFDASKTFYDFVCLLISLSATVQAFLIEDTYRIQIAAVVLVFPLLWASRRLHPITSPLSSELTTLRLRAVGLAVIATALFSLSYIAQSLLR